MSRGYTERMITMLISLLAMLCGAFLFVYGGYDDSPGAQLLGAILFILGIFCAVRKRKRDSR